MYATVASSASECGGGNWIPEHSFSVYCRAEGLGNPCNSTKYTVGCQNTELFNIVFN